MGSREIVAGFQQTIYVGSTTISNPILFLEVDGIPITGSYVYEQIASSKRFIFPKVQNGNIYIVSMGVVYKADLPSHTINVKVHIAE